MKLPMGVSQEGLLQGVSKEELLEGVSKEEFCRYLDIFREAKYFAAIKAGGDCLGEDLAATLRSLHGYGLYPIVVHGGGNKINQEFEERGIKYEKIDEIRITPKKDMPIVEEVLKDVNSSFVEQVNENGVYAEGLNGVFCINELDPRYGWVGNASDMDQESIDACLEKKHIPIISCLGLYQGNNEYVNQNADTAFSFVVRRLHPKKVIMLTGVGGVFEQDRLISEVNTHDELEYLLNADFVNGGMKFKLHKAKELVNERFDVQITSPENLMVELFSAEGCGTYIRS